MHFSFHDLPFLAGIPIEQWEDGKTLVISEEGRAFLRLGATTYQEVTAEFSEYRKGIALGEFSVVGYESGFHQLGLDSSGATALTEDIVILRPSEMSIGGNPPQADVGQSRVQLGPALGAARHDTVDELTLRLDSAGSQETSSDDVAQNAKLDVGIENDLADQSDHETAFNTSDSDQFPSRPDVIGLGSALPEGRQDPRIEPARHAASLPDGSQLPNKEPVELQPGLGKEASHREFRPAIEYGAAVKGKDESYQTSRPKEDSSASLKIGGDPTCQLPSKEPSLACGRLHADESHHTFAQDAVALEPALKSKDESYQREFVEGTRAADAFDRGDVSSYHRDFQDDAGGLSNAIDPDSGHRDRGVDLGGVSEVLSSGDKLLQRDLGRTETTVGEGQQFQNSDPAKLTSSVEDGLNLPHVEPGSLGAAMELGRQTWFTEQNQQAPRVAPSVHAAAGTEKGTVTQKSAEGRHQPLEARAEHSGTLEAGGSPRVEGETSTSRLQVEIGVNLFEPPESGGAQSRLEIIEQIPFKEATDQTQNFDGAYEQSQEERATQSSAAFGANEAELAEAICAGGPDLAGTHRETEEHTACSNRSESIHHEFSLEQDEVQLSLAESHSRQTQSRQAAVGASIMGGRKTYINFLRSSELANLPANSFDGGANFNEQLPYSNVLRDVGPYTVDSDVAPWPLIPDFPEWYLPAPLTCDDELGVWTADMDSFQ